MTNLSKAGQWLEAQTAEDTRPIIPATQQQRQTAKEAHFANTIRIEFWNGEYTFTNCNDEPITGKVNGQDHANALLKRAMERARDEGKKLILKNGMDTERFKTVTDEDIETHC